MTELEQESNSQIKDFIMLSRKSLYIDGCFTGLPLEDDAICFQEVSTACLARAVMDLRKRRGNTMGKEQNSGDKVFGVK